MFEQVIEVKAVRILLTGYSQVLFPHLTLQKRTQGDACL